MQGCTERPSRGVLAVGCGFPGTPDRRHDSSLLLSFLEQHEDSSQLAPPNPGKGMRCTGPAAAHLL